MVEGSPNPQLVTQGPDLFGYYKHEIIHLLTQHDPNTNSITPAHVSSSSPSCLFGNSLEGPVPVFQRDLWMSSLRQGVSAFTLEVDEITDTVIRFRHALDCLNLNTKESSGEDLDSAPPCRKKQKRLSPDGNEDGIGLQMENVKKERGEVDEALKTLLSGEPGLVEETMLKYSDQNYAMLNHMEQQLEELLDALVSKCRLMTHPEKQQLRRLIQKLPARSLDRVVEILHQGKSADRVVLSEEIVIDLEGQENATLWRLYFYTKAVEKAVENARKFAA